MEFEHFLFEKLADDLSPDQMDNYWKAIHAYNSWKKNKKNSMMVKYKLAYIYHEYPLDDRAKGKIRSLIDTIATYIETGEDTTVIKHREPKDETPVQNEKPAEVEIDSSDYQKIELTNEFVNQAFDKFNAKYFDNKLDKLPVKIESMGNCMGKFSYSVNFSAQKMVPEYILINHRCDVSLAEFRNTLVHEMLHYYVHCYDNGLTENDWYDAYHYYCRGKKRKWRSILNCSDATCHNGIWLKKAKELNKKFKELGITKNEYLSKNAEQDKMALINKLKDAFIVESYYEYDQIFGKIKKNYTYSIMNRTDFEKLMSICKEGVFEYDGNDYKLQYEARLHGINCLNGATYKISAAKIEAPQALALFPINDIDKEPYLMGKEQFKQMTHTQAFKPLKKVGEVKTIRKEETKTESTELNFKTWLNEKTSKKWDVNKLKALGLSDEEIADLLNGEADDEVCSIS